MDSFFPHPEMVAIAPGVDALLFKYKDTDIQLSSLAPGAILHAHQHSQAQLGLALAGQFIMEVNGNKTTLGTLSSVYVVDPEVSHAASNPFDEQAIGLDIKHSGIDSQYYVENDVFLSILEEKTFKTGLRNVFFVGPWFEVMVSRIPPGGSMPTHSHSNVQIGAVVTGGYVMQVGEEEQEFRYGQVYVAPGGVSHGAHNPFTEEACSVNIFFPPRYHKFTRKRT